jgi:hypothetical protein
LDRPEASGILAVAAADSTGWEMAAAAMVEERILVDIRGKRRVPAVAAVPEGIGDPVVVAVADRESGTERIQRPSFEAAVVRQQVVVVVAFRDVVEC